MPTIDEQLRFFAVRVNNGSGCIFQPNTEEYSYVFTVKHNIKKKDDSICSPQEVIVRRFNLDSDPIRVIAVHPIDEVDLAILVIQYLGEANFQLSYSKPKRNEPVSVFGYPDYLLNEDVKFTSLRCVVDLEHHVNRSIEIVADQNLATFNRGAQNNVIGFSGSGVFFIEGDQVILKGIFQSLNDPEAAHGKLVGYYIDCFNEKIASEGLAEIVPSCLASFNYYKQAAFNSINAVIRNGLQPNLENIANCNITPRVISTHYKGGLYTPYSEDYNNRLLNQKMWKAWIELLTCLDISTENPVYTLNSFMKNVKLYHSVNKNVIQEFVATFLQDQTLMSSISANDIVAYSSDEHSALTYLKKERIQKIVHNISKSRVHDPSVKIDNPERIKPFSCIHVDHFAEKMAQIDTDLTSDEILNQIKVEIQNILRYGTN